MGLLPPGFCGAEMETPGGDGAGAARARREPALLRLLLEACCVAPSGAARAAAERAEAEAAAAAAFAARCGYGASKLKVRTLGLT